MKEFQGKALDANLVSVGKARFTVLDAGLLRLEYAPDALFEDRPSFFAVHRDAPPQSFTVRPTLGGVEISTSRLRLVYQGGPFTPANLQITVLDAGEGGPVVWRPGAVATGNLGGTLRTLDEAWGPLDLGQGVLSRDGWALVDDSTSPLMVEGSELRAEGRRGQGAQDWYFFGYGLDHRAALAGLSQLGGRIPLPPRFAFGSWYSRYWPYSSEDFFEIAAQYKAHGFPLDVMVIDMDWHEDGWTGYTWNKKLIPDPKKLLNQLHDLGLKVTLNLHPHGGVQAHEAAYAGFARAMGLDPALKTAIPFDITDPKFADGYFRVLLDPLEKDGVDFWWMDWQQGTETRVAGLDPLMWLNALHFRERQRPENAAFPEPGSPAKRGMNFSRWAGMGDQRHPVHFSGDTHSNWEILEFLPYFTSTAGNVGAAYWSHDMGGHFATTGVPDAELFTRWIQFGVFSPVLRVHSTRHPEHDRRPWRFGEPFTAALRQAYQLREDLRPYLYTAARHCHDSGVAPLRPMYIDHPRERKAYEVPGQFMFGPDLLVAPATRPGSGPERVTHVKVWFPEGDWYHLLTAERYQGPGERMIAVGLADLAVFARGGAPIPLSGGRVRLFPGPSTVRELYEDDGESDAYLRAAFRRIPLASKALEGGGQELRVGPATGQYRGAPAQRPAMTVEAPLSAEGGAPIPGGPLGETVSVALRPQAATLPARQDPRAAGLSLQLALRPGAKLGALICEVELRLEDAAAGEGRLRLLDDAGALLAAGTLGAGGLSRQARLSLQVDPEALALHQGRLELELDLAQGALRVSEPWAWDARQVREWMFLGPLPKGLGPAAADALKGLAAGASYPGLKGGRCGWEARRFEPVAGMRALGPLYHFGDTFRCPEGEVWALALLESPEPGPCRLGFQCGGDGAFWLNGDMLQFQDSQALVRLQRGPNTLLVRLRNAIHAGSGVAVTVQEADGGPRGLSARLPAAAFGRV